MSDTGSSGDNKPQQQDDVNLGSPPAAAAAPPEVENKPVTPAKRTPSKRVSAVERAQRESEELVKTLGGSLDIEGGRKTRSSTRGTPSRSNAVATPPPAKKARAASGTPRRGRGRKIDTAIESEQKTTPEKKEISSDPEAEAEPEPELELESKSKPEVVKNAEESIAVEAAPKTEDKVDEVTPETKITSPVADEKQSPAKVEDKPEPMEVDGVAKNENDAPSETMETNESTKETTESSAENSLEEKSEQSDKVLAATVVEEEKEESSSAVEENAVSAVAVDEDKIAEVESKPVENSIGNNIDVNNTEENATSLPTDEVCPTKPPPVAAPVPVSVSAGNDHKTESNDFCEPKIASPPITANNDGATPQYCN